MMLSFPAVLVKVGLTLKEETWNWVYCLVGILIGVQTKESYQKKRMA
jgi:hypothetical protein